MTHSFPTRRSSVLCEVPRRLRFELRLATSRAEVEAPAFVLGDVARGGAVDSHAADRVLRRQVFLRSLHELVAAAGIAEVEDSARVLVGRRSEEHTSELQSLMRISYAVFCLK